MIYVIFFGVLIFYYLVVLLFNRNK